MEKEPGVVQQVYLNRFGGLRNNFSDIKRVMAEQRSPAQFLLPRQVGTCSAARFVNCHSIASFELECSSA
jgi:hypothetical protein